jgi:hypothetical protein
VKVTFPSGETALGWQPGCKLRRGDGPEFDPRDQPGVTIEDEPGDTALPEDFFCPGRGLLAQTLVERIERRQRFAVDVTGRIYEFRSGVWRPDGEDAIRRAAASLLGDRYRISHGSTAVELFRIREPLFTDESFDTRYLNLPNGLLDWQTGTLLPHSADVPTTIRLPIPWDPGAACPAISTFLANVFTASCRSFVKPAWRRAVSANAFPGFRRGPPGCARATGVRIDPGSSFNDASGGPWSTVVRIASERVSADSSAAWRSTRRSTALKFLIAS